MLLSRYLSPFLSSSSFSLPFPSSLFSTRRCSGLLYHSHGILLLQSTLPSPPSSFSTRRREDLSCYARDILFFPRTKDQRRVEGEDGEGEKGGEEKNRERFSTSLQPMYLPPLVVIHIIAYKHIFKFFVSIFFRQLVCQE